MAKYRYDTDLWQAFIRRMYAKGSLSINDAAAAFADDWCDQGKWGDEPGYAEDMCKHYLQMGVAHFLGVTYSDQRHQILTPDPQSDEQRWAWEVDWCGGNLSDETADAWSRHFNTIPWRFSPGWRRRYQLHKFDYHKGIRAG